MAIKASGYTLERITEETGYVTSTTGRYSAITVPWGTTQDKDLEKESLEVSLGSVTLLPGIENKRPSVEIGFHAFLKRCVIHTHAVYATGENEAQTIEETLVGVAYVISMIRKAGFKLRQMDEKGADFINSWESEKYRSRQIK